MARPRIGMCLNVAASALVTLPCAAAPLPSVVETAIAEQISGCAPQKGTLLKGFLTRRDVNGDAMEDFVLDYGHFQCGDRKDFYCGSAGCITQVFASLRGGGYVKVLDSNVREIRFTTLRGKPAMVLGLHGSSCGKIGVEPCARTALWNGKTFRPLR